MRNPYERLPDTSFWRTAVAQRDPLSIDQLWTSKFPITRHDQIVTAGSCFAQYIGRELVQSGFRWMDTEPAPARLSAANRRRFNYGVFSFRSGNIYNVSLLRQWLEWATGLRTPSDEVWVAEGRFRDPFRPAIEPDGFGSEAELFAMRSITLEAIRRAVTQADVLIFTLGLTEMWVNARDGCVYPTCPGTMAGVFDADVHVFRNASYPAILQDLTASVDLMHALNPRLRVLLTVSPVPLTATASSKHVLVATVQSKSTLRAVAGDLARGRDDIDYFPSYDIVTGVPFRGMFYEADMRAIAPHGVDFVMQAFFSGLRTDRVALHERSGLRAEPEIPDPPGDADDDLICEDRLLEAFRRGAP